MHRDKGATLNQNYRKLGLSARLNAPTGGTEKTAPKTAQASNSSGSTPAPSPADPLHVTAAAAARLATATSEARVERDPATGRILRVLHPELEERTEVAGRSVRAANPLDDPYEDLVRKAERATRGVEAEGFVTATNGNGSENGERYGKRAREEEKTEAVRALERQAAQEEQALLKRRPRVQSRREEEWIGRLLQRHGDDLLAMVRDKRLNPMQQTMGDIKRRIAKYKASHGTGE